MTLDEAIKHAEEVAREHERRLKVYENIDEDRPLFKEEENACKKCAEEHRQLAEWLKELKQLREKIRGIPVSERPPEDIELVIKLPKKWLNDMKREEFIYVDELCEAIQHGTKIPEDATNGDIIKAMFLVETVDDFCKSFGVKLNNSNYIQFNKDWWNAPYKAEGR